MSKYGKITRKKESFISLGALLLAAGLLLAQGTISARADEGNPFGEFLGEAKEALATTVSEREIMGVVYLCAEYSLRQAPSQGAEEALRVPCGQTVTILDMETDEAGSLWLKVHAQIGSAGGEGWMERRNLACSDERFLSMEALFKGQAVMLAGEAAGSPDTGKDVDSEIPEDVLQFPKSYRNALTALKELHPNWIFVPMNTGLDWESAVTEELQYGKSLVHSSFPDWTKEGAYDEGNWFYASREVLERYMDPRNSLTEDAIFQFEQLTYNESYHTQEALKAFLENTFMNSGQNAPGTSMTYDLIIWSVGKEPGREVSPFHLASRICQEQGSGNSPLISGTYPGYEGYYNHFNIGATGTTAQEVIENGLKFARQENWTDAYYSILGGADFLAGNYIKRGQDTLYLQKFNVNPGSVSPVYTHQYMQNISAPTTEAAKIKELYGSAEALSSPFVFKIPTFENMPKKVCPMPQSSKNVVLQIPEGCTATEIFVDDEAVETQRRNGRLIAALGNTKAKKAEMFQKDENGETALIFRWDLSYENNRYQADAWPVALTPTSLMLSVPKGFDGTDVWVDGIRCGGAVYKKKLIVSAPDKKAKTAVMYRYNESGVPTDMYVWTLKYQKKEFKATAQPDLQGLLSYHGFSIRISGKSGIRFKSGIGVQTRKMLRKEGVDGYRLKEYGTLVMTRDNMELYPMVKGGEKVACGMSYGTREDGTKVDTVFEKVDERYRFTSVLVGLPAEQYKTEFAFRSYLILEKNGKEMTIYGPPVARSIYHLAQQALDLKLYKKGSAAYKFLKKLIKAADALEEQ